MAERSFYAALLLVTLGYLYFAFFTIRAPIQYDPLGPESWPRILGCIMAISLAVRLVRPTGVIPVVARRTGIKLVVVVGLMALYALLFERLGFILSTWGFCTATTLLLGTRWPFAVLFGGLIGVIGFYFFTALLDLNLPGGVLGFLG